ncbi:uncharacterized protein [Ptychodera flava]|uniref:uncharacterized protein n=1 Tax=Ptychodera flava TaxID=63121 RepID=UPI00396A8803
MLDFLVDTRRVMTEYFGNYIMANTSNVVTIQGCIGACRDRGKTIAVLESTDQCFCGDDSVDYGHYGEAIPGLLILNDTNAVRYNTHKCSGDTGTQPYVQGCGGDWQFDVYDTSFGACGGDYTDSSGYIYSPNFPGNYINEQSCNWTITLDPGHIVKLTTLMLRLQDSDMVIVKDGIEDHSSTISTFTGYSPPQPLYSSSNTLRIEMITDIVGNDLGFIVQFEEFIKAETTISSSTQQSTQMTSDTTKKTTVSKGPSQQPPATVSSTVDTSTVQLHTVILISIEQSTKIKNTSRQMTVTSTPTKSATSQETEDRIITKSRSTDVSKHFTSASASSEGIGSNEDMYMYIGIGGGMFIFLALVLIVVIVVLMRGKQRTKTQESDENMLKPIPDLVRKSDSAESVNPDVTPAVRESGAHTAFINESYRPESVAPNRESIGEDDRHRIDETLTGGLTADYELLGPVNDKEPVHPQSIDKTPSQLDDSYAPVDMHKKRSNINSTYEWKSEMESQHGLTDRQNTNEDMQTTEDAPVDDRESEDVPAVPERSQLRLEDSEDVGQMYAQVDKSKKKGRTNETGYVDNVLYESMSDKEPSQREGFVDNIVYESASNMV